MNILIFAFFLALTGIVSAATGDILSVVVREEGWTADVTIEGKLDEGLYDFGLGTNNTVTGSPKVVFTVVSHGFTDTGAATTIARTVYGVHPMRKAWPNDASNEEVESGGNVTVRIILSDYIYAKDNTGAGNSGTAPTVNILSGFYTQSGGNNATGAGFPVTNNSTAVFQPVVMNWSWPGYQRVTPTTRFRAVAFHRHGQEYRPVRAVKFIMSDGMNEVSELVTTPTITAGFGDARPVIEFVTTGSLVAGLTQGAELTANFIAYPWVGDNPGDSSTGATAPSPLVGPQKHLCDANETFEITVARVDPATGNDSGANTVYPVGTYNPSTAYKFASISKAAAAIAAYNNSNYGRNDVGAGIIKCDAGNYAWLGNTGSYGSTPRTYITIMPNDGVARADVVINSASGNGDISDRIKIENCTITVSTNNTFTNINAIWLDQCDINSAGTGIFNTNGGIFSITRGLVRQLAQGLQPVSTANCTPALIRGNDLTGLDDRNQIYTFIGNYNGGLSSAIRFVDEIFGQTGPRAVPIMAYNELLGLDGSGNEVFTIGGQSANTVGGAIVQNAFENYSTGTSGLGGIGNTFFEHNNMVVWHNSFVGQRVFMGYNDDGSTAYYRRYWSQLNNYWDRWANKGDNFAPQDANRIGGWPVKFMVGSSGNYLSQNLQSLPGNFYAEFDGLSSYEPLASTSGTWNDHTLALFTDRQSATGSGANTISAGAGLGDYTLQAASPLIGRPIVNVLPYDLDGVSRQSGNNAAGAYAGPVPPPPPSTINATTTNAGTITVQ